VERGTHESLYSAQGRYWDLYTKQHGVEANLFLPAAGPEEATTVAPVRSPSSGGLSDAIRLLRG
jgi:subfamily B ATP-binding cassette protein MsbA